MGVLATAIDAGEALLAEAILGEGLAAELRAIRDTDERRAAE
jgi:hypothetical protein